MDRSPRRISWVKVAHKGFARFPLDVQRQMHVALAIAARGEKAAVARPLRGLGSGVFEIAIAYRRDAYRAIYVVQAFEDIWVVHAFQKKATQGIKTPKKEIDLIRDRIKRLQEQEP